MKRSLIIFITLVGLTIVGSNVMAVPVKSDFGPGNSAAAKGTFPNSQPNCVGDIVSTLARRGEIGSPGPGVTPKEPISNSFTFGAIIGFTPFDTCSDFFPAP